MINITYTPSKPIDLFWENVQFKPVQELFPQWIAAEIILTDYVDRLSDDFEANDDNVSMRSVTVGSSQPMARDELSGLLVPMWQMFPIEDQPLFCEIYQKCVNNYLPDLVHYYGQKLNQPTLYTMKNEILSFHQQIKCAGGPEFKDWLRFNLGLYSNLNGINFIDFKAIT